MREMVLNHASISAPTVEKAVDCLCTVTRGMATLVQQNHATKMLRSRVALYSLQVVGTQSLYDILITMRRQGLSDEFVFFSSLAIKAPLDVDLPQDAVSRFLGCEAVDLPVEDGEPLVLCAVTDAIAVGFPSAPIWSGDRVTVRFRELVKDGVFEDTEETIDHLSRVEHAYSIVDRARRLARGDIRDGTLLWNRRVALFPLLTFGPDVERQIRDLAGDYLGRIIRRLSELNEATSVWRESGAVAPIWPCKVTAESASVQNDPDLREARRFRSSSGHRELFLDHARIGNSTRIHMRINSTSRSIEIGYIGPHLSL
jgi:hypothetical protein